MAIGPLALDDQPTVSRSSFLTGLALWGHHCSAALDASRQQHQHSDTAQRTAQHFSAATPTSPSPEGLNSNPSDAALLWESPSSGSKGTPQQNHSQSRTGQHRSENQRSVRWSDSSSSGISAPQGRRRPVATLMLATIPHASYLMAEPSPAPLMSLFMLSDTARHICAGTAARTMAQAFIHPIDTVKTRLQVRTPEGLLKTWRKSTRQYPFDFQVGGRRILQTRNVLVAGPRDVYLGFTGAVLGTIPTAVIYFTVYEWSKRQLEKRGWSSAAGHIGSASAGAVMSALVRVPTDTLKHQVQAYLHDDVFQAARTICRTSGVHGLYRGFWPTLARDVPEIAIQFTLYERLRKVVEQRQGTQRLRTWQHLLLGGISGAVAASVTMPLDYIKTATQCGSPLGAKELVRLTLRDKGARGLFAGMVPRVTQTAIMSAMFFTLFEMWKAALKRDRAPEDSRLNTKMWRKRRDHVWKRQFVLE